MSLILDDTFFQTKNKSYQVLNSGQQHNNNEQFINFILMRLSYELSYHQFLFKNLQIRKNNQIVILVHHKLYKSKQILFKLKFNYKKFYFQIQVDLLQNGAFFVIKNLAAKLQLSKQFQKQLFNQSFIHNFTICIDTGKINLKYSNFLIVQQTFDCLKKLSNLKNSSKMLTIIRCAIQCSLQPLAKLLSLSQQSFTEHLMQQNSEQRFQLNKLRQNIIKPMVLKLMVPSFFGNQELRRFQSIQFEQHRFQIQLQKLKVTFNNEYYQILTNPHYYVNTVKLNPSYLKVEIAQLENYQKIVEPEKLKISSSNDENRYIFNKISIINPQSLKLKKLKSTTFSDLYYCLLEFRQIGSESQVKKNKYFRQCLDQEICQNKPAIKKTLVLKKEKRQKPFRNLHQIQILMRFKGSSSVFFPKYYYSSDERFKDYVFSEHISFPILNQFLQNSKTTLSLRTKIRIALMIAQALRVLKNYQIVHLDLKLQNIFIYKDLFIKLIDFGQSYHQQVCKQNAFKPGFTFPYCSPQVFVKNYKFNQKQDVYSFGILLHMIIFQRSPLIINDKEGVKALKINQYLKYWFYSTQNAQGFGPPFIIHNLVQLISCCLDCEQKRRPYIDWICLILKQCENYLGNY